MVAAGRQVIRWDGKDSRGQEVNKGIYLVRLITGKTAKNKKIIKQ
jgi:flagellar hook assembly protein FlgD